ncbi:DsbB superfamily disulfide bond formation protein [Candidatus Cyrtobacter comes]|uniref:DsbB superfamily disulfide bond formation protein n=1 Tax=Candidatus Cyrtobacter comes TaxID=675776 RepID=A0ABU5L803_9RICK|nr:disulfide bond formation protein B [Candidatus Cyrtobacter comes]MDZ5762256.1 DsbB superfamily disulfide bond formation protein [Candidatus Cyrtobacter comes]
MVKKNLNALLLIALSAIVSNVIALLFQFLYHEIPCPLCLLQRFGLLAIAYGAIIGLRSHGTFRHLVIILISSLFTLAVGLRQVFLHILPNDKGYGTLFFGLHFYTWSAILSFSLIIILAIAPLLDRINLTKYIAAKFITKIQNFIYDVFILLCITNVIMTFLGCGITGCPDDPVNYQYLPSH